MAQSSSFVPKKNSRSFDGNEKYYLHSSKNGSLLSDMIDSPLCSCRFQRWIMFIFPPAPSASNPPTRTQKPCSSVLISTTIRQLLVFCACFFDKADEILEIIKSHHGLPGFRNFVFYILIFDFGCGQRPRWVNQRLMKMSIKFLLCVLSALRGRYKTKPI
jgi:hypothetical protein